MQQQYVQEKHTKFPRLQELEDGKEVRTALVREIKQCGKRKDLQGGKLLHGNAIEAGCHNNRYVAHTLISMYGKCGSMGDARDVFKSMLQHDVVSWTALIRGYVENGENLTALELFSSMDCAPNCYTYVALLKACAELATGNELEKKSCLQKGKAIHRRAKECGCDEDMLVSSTLVDMYRKCGSMEDARDVFNRMAQHDVVSWTTIILGYVENGESLMALGLLSRMEYVPDRFMFVAALKVYAGLASENQLEKKRCLEKGMAIHKEAREYGFGRDLFVATTLVDMYSKCGSMVFARNVFESMIHRTVVTWTALILGYVENGENLMALEMFDSMDCAPNSVTFVAALKACAGLDKETCIQKGKAIHREARERGFDKNVFVTSSLVDMYSKCGCMQDARSVFDSVVRRDIVSWTALILGYVESGESTLALEAFFNMDCAPNNFTFVAVVRACSSLGALPTGKSIHSEIVRLGLEEEEMVATSLVDLYGKCGKMDAAEEVFNWMHCWDIVSWTALIGGYTLLGNVREVFTVVKKMQEGGLQMDTVTMLLVLTACSHAGMVEEGQRCFNTITKPSVEHYTCMVDMLGRANRLQEALLLVRNVCSRVDNVIWMTLLGACRKWSNVEIGEVAFHALVNKNENRDEVTAACVLMQNIYSRLGMHHEEEQVRAMRNVRGSWKISGRTWWCDSEGRMQLFVAGDKMEGDMNDQLKALLMI